MKLSKFLNLNKLDFIKGAITAAISAVLTFIYSCFSNGIYNLDYQMIGQIAGLAFVSYLVKNVFTNSNGQLVKKEPTNTSDL